jgi:hypothetical protein
MFITSGNSSLAQTTAHKVVLPFYLYAAFSFLVATILLLATTPEITIHYFQPHTLAITHIMALGWGTMIILGASHQLVPVMIEGRLYSNRLALASFVLAALGIPLLVYSFYVFEMGTIACLGGLLISLSIIAYIINLGMSMAKSKHENIHAYFVFTASIWLLATAILGLLLIYNFTQPFLSKDSLAYLPLHAHLGIVGWFLLLVMRIGSRLIPMFIISKYENTKILWWIYGLINLGLLSFLFIFLYTNEKRLLAFPLSALALAIFLFGNYCYRSYQKRIRKKIDDQMRISLLSVLMIFIPLIILLLIITISLAISTENIRLSLIYGFTIFFGWITAIILGMTFKTLPFIIWNKTYHHLAGKGKTPNPKDLFNQRIFKIMAITYLLGFLLFPISVFYNWPLGIRLAAILLLLTALLYNWNVLKLFMHKSRSI